MKIVVRELPADGAFYKLTKGVYLFVSTPHTYSGTPMFTLRHGNPVAIRIVRGSLSRWRPWVLIWYWLSYQKRFYIELTKHWQQTKCIFWRICKTSKLKHSATGMAVIMVILCLAQQTPSHDVCIWETFNIFCTSQYRSHNVATTLFPNIWFKVQ